MSSQACNVCGETTLESDNHHGQQTLVCTSCGSMENVVDLTQQIDYEGLTGTTHCTNQTYFNGPAPRGIQHSLAKKIPEGRKRGLATLANLKSVFHMQNEMEKEAKELFLQAFNMPAFHQKTLGFKHFLAGACAYTVMRRRDWPISVNNVCYALGCSKEDLAKAMRLMTRHLNIHFQTPPIEELILSVAGGMAPLGDEKQVVIDKTTEILLLCSKCWLTTSRSPRVYIITAISLAWQTLNASRLKITPQKFCEMMGIVHPSSMAAVKKNILNVLVKLAEMLPWVEKVEQKTVISFLNDVLRFQKTLRQEAILKFQIESANDDEDLEDEEENETNAKKTGNSIEKDALLLFRTPYHKRPATEPINLLLSDEINENEIDSYIRSEKEVRTLLQLEREANGSLN